MRIAVFGDSFATNDGTESWVYKLAQGFDVDNFAARGASEYRIYKTVKQQPLKKYDCVIIFHTNPDRVFIPDHTRHPSRTLDSHPFCDMLANDSLSKARWADVVNCYYKNFYDQEFQTDMFGLLLEKMMTIHPNTLHYTGFDLPHTAIVSFHHLRQSNPGNSNHLDQDGNNKVYQHIKEHLK
jgi:hypothetical protein